MHLSPHVFVSNIPSPSRVKMIICMESRTWLFGDLLRMESAWWSATLQPFDHFSAFFATGTHPIIILEPMDSVVLAELVGWTHATSNLKVGKVSTILPMRLDMLRVVVWVMEIVKKTFSIMDRILVKLISWSVARLWWHMNRDWLGCGSYELSGCWVASGSSFPFHFFSLNCFIIACLDLYFISRYIVPVHTNILYIEAYSANNRHA